MSINIYLLNKIGGKKHESECSELWSNKQTNVASRAKRGMKQQPSFGMKMNNRQVSQKDNVSFGAPKWWDKVDKAARKTAAVVMMPGLFIGAGMLEAAIDEIVNEDKYKNLSTTEQYVRRMSKTMGGFAMLNEDSDADLSPREESAMHVVDEYKLASGASDFVSSSIPIVAPMAESLTIGAKQKFLMVEEIADIYEINDKERKGLYRSLGLGDREQFLNVFSSGIPQTISKGLDEVSQNTTSEFIQEAASGLSDSMVIAAPILKSGINSWSTKKLGKEAIKKCKQIISNRY